ncbi:MAG TPA: molybdate ABC transporter substrate-binding protein [Rhodobacteraceae bacterium]|nr:molybdate ABC transporter substrate-binding protein [Paracoccaceae bacterium]
MKIYAGVWALLRAAVLLLTLPNSVMAGEITVAVASNFLTTINKLARSFENSTGHHLRIVNGSTGALYAQISKGAPYDVFLSADQQRIDMLGASGHLLEGAQKPYALGILVLYARDPGYLRKDVAGSLQNPALRHFAMADPSTAPYGRAAREVLDNLELPELAETKAVLGANVGQAFGFVRTGNAELGFVALSQAVAEGGEWIDIPEGLYQPVIQQAGLLTASRGNEPAHMFYDFLSSETARGIIKASGYGVP